MSVLTFLAVDGEDRGTSVLRVFSVQWRGLSLSILGPLHWRPRCRKGGVGRQKVNFEFRITPHSRLLQEMSRFVSAHTHYQHLWDSETSLSLFWFLSLVGRILYSYVSESPVSTEVKNPYFPWPMCLPRGPVSTTHENPYGSVELSWLSSINSIAKEIMKRLCFTFCVNSRSVLETLKERSRVKEVHVCPLRHSWVYEISNSFTTKGEGVDVKPDSGGGFLSQRNRAWRASGSRDTWMTHVWWPV